MLFFELNQSNIDPQKNDVSKTIFLFEVVLFRGHLNFFWGVVFFQLPMFFLLDTLPETKSSHLKKGRAPKGSRIVFQPSIFRCCVMLVLGSVYLEVWLEDDVSIG